MSVELHCEDAISLLRRTKADLVLTSPPYLSQRLYGRTDIARSAEEWVSWMLDVADAALECAPHLILVVAGATVKKNYIPAPEGLAWEWYKRGRHQDTVAIWSKNGMCGTGGRWLRRDSEYFLSFKRAEKRVKKKGEAAVWVDRYWADPMALATPRKYASGGRFKNRKKDGEREDGAYPKNELSHPSSIQRFTVGGGHMGHELACENEAPFPLALASFFVKGWCPPGGTVADVFCGSGTVGHACLDLDRNFIGGDLRMDQVDLSRRRLEDVARRAGRSPEDATKERTK